MPMSCQCEVNHDDIVHETQTQMTSCHLIPTWHEWNAKADNVMMSRQACVMDVTHVLYVNLALLSI